LTGQENGLLPVKVEDLAVKEVQLCQGRAAGSASPIHPGNCSVVRLWIEVDEDKRFPRFPPLPEAIVFLAVKVLHALELRHSLKSRPDRNSTRDMDNGGSRHGRMVP